VDLDEDLASFDTEQCGDGMLAIIGTSLRTCLTLRRVDLAGQGPIG